MFKSICSSFLYIAEARKRKAVVKRNVQFILNYEIGECPFLDFARKKTLFIFASGS